MKEQRVLVLSGSDYASEMQDKIDQYTEQGWMVVSITAQHVATGSIDVKRGGYIMVFERHKQN